MEILDILLVTIIPTFLFIFYVSKSIRSITRPIAPLPPGKLGLPILGESMAFLSNLMASTPERFIQDRIKRHASSTFKTSLFGDPMVVVYGAAGNKFAFANEEKLVRAWWPKTADTLFGGSSISLSDVFQMKDLASYLKPDRLHKYVGIMDSMARSHLQAKWHGQQQHPRSLALPLIAPPLETLSPDLDPPSPTSDRSTIAPFLLHFLHFRSPSTIGNPKSRSGSGVGDKLQRRSPGTSRFLRRLSQVHPRCPHGGGGIRRRPCRISRFRRSPDN